MAKKNLSTSQIILVCPECGSTRLMRYYEEEDIVCMDCGLVINSKIAEQSSEQIYNSKQQKKVTGQLPSETSTIREKGFSTAITDNMHEDEILNQKILTIRNWQKLLKVSDATERNLALALLEITRIANDLSLPKNVIEAASIVYKKTAEKLIIKRRSIRAISAATVYMACRQRKLPRTLNEVASASKMSTREVGRNYIFLMKKLNFLIQPTKPNQYTSKLSTQLPMRRKTKEITNKILKVADDLKLASGRDPMGMAAAASYIASLLAGERKTQREIAEVARITEATIRNRYKELAKLLLFTVSL
jgi:transcription initiation factor TFIIB